MLHIEVGSAKEKKDEVGSAWRRTPLRAPLQIQAAFKAADVDGDGKLSFQEFCIWAFSEVENEAPPPCQRESKDTNVPSDVREVEVRPSDACAPRGGPPTPQRRVALARRP
jgi:EF hand.